MVGQVWSPGQAAPEGLGTKSAFPMGQPTCPPVPEQLLLSCACTTSQEGMELPSASTTGVLLHCQNNLGGFCGLWSKVLPLALPTVQLRGRGAGGVFGCAKQL